MSNHVMQIVILINTIISIVSLVSVAMVLVYTRRKISETMRIQQQFVANVSHELRTPLGIIYAYSEMMANGDFPEEMILETIQRMHTAALRLKWTIENIILVQMVYDVDVLLAEPLNMADVTTAAYNEARQMNDKGIEFVSHIDATRTIVNGHTQLIQAAVSNLIDNAAKFGSKRVIVSLVDDDDNVVLSVEDDGIGVDDSIQDLIFNFFQQGDGSDTRMYGGVGIGLWIVEQVAEKHGGRVWFASKVGKGSVFYLSLPVIDE